jgi:serine/threonine protein kinase
MVNYPLIIKYFTSFQVSRAHAVDDKTYLERDSNTWPSAFEAYVITDRTMDPSRSRNMLVRACPQDIEKVYIVMDFIIGGELFSLIKLNRRMPEEMARFYCAEVWRPMKRHSQGEVGRPCCL